MVRRNGRAICRIAIGDVPDSKSNLAEMKSASSAKGNRRAASLKAEGKTDWRSALFSRFNAHNDTPPIGVNGTTHEPV